MVLPVLGRSLSSVLYACGGRFSLPTVLMIADQLVINNRLKLVATYVSGSFRSVVCNLYMQTGWFIGQSKYRSASQGFNGSHRDLKPDNFLIGRGLWDKTIYVIDLGMAKVYRDDRGLHIPWRTNKGFWGNPRYASVGAHEGNGLFFFIKMNTLNYWCLTEVSDIRAKSTQRHGVLSLHFD